MKSLPIARFLEFHFIFSHSVFFRIRSSGTESRQLFIFMLLRARHEVLHNLADICTLIENLIECIRQRHFDVIALRKTVCSAAAVIAFDGADLLDGCLRRNALTDQDTRSAVARMHRGAGHDQVADAGQSG